MLRAEELSGILGLAQRLGVALDLWTPQNQIWEWAATHPAALDRDTLSRLARNLWFDEATLAARAGYAAQEP